MLFAVKEPIKYINKIFCGYGFKHCFCKRVSFCIMPLFHRRLLFGPSKSSCEGVVWPSSVTACVSTGSCRAGFKPEGDSHGSCVSIVIS